MRSARLLAFFATFGTVTCAVASPDAIIGDLNQGSYFGQSDGIAAYAFGYATCNLGDGPLVFVQTGGDKSRGLLAFNRADGTLRWHAPHGLRGSYSSPAIATLGGVRQVVASAGDLVYAVSPSDGRLLWSIKGPGSGESVANPPQVLSDDRVLITFGNGRRQIVQLSGKQSGLINANKSLTIDLDGGARQIKSVMLIGSSGRRASIDVIAV